MGLEKELGGQGANIKLVVCSDNYAGLLTGRNVSPTRMHLGLSRLM